MKDGRLSSLNLIKKLKKLSDPKQAKDYEWFFKTGPGEYGYGDKFLGIRVPILKKIAKQFKDLSFSDIRRMLKSDIHEHRFVALKILVLQYKNADDIKRKNIVNFYLRNTKRINNWDLVDTSAQYILGDYLLSKDKSILYELAVSKIVWERRIAIISTAGFIKKGSYKDTLKIAEILLQDEHDLIHKAVGWMLREVGKQSLKIEVDFLNRYYEIMPRTMLRYAIERFPEKHRRMYLKRKN